MNKAEQLIACLEGEIAKRDARIVELGVELEGEREAARDGNAEYLELQSERDFLHAELAAIKAQEPVAWETPSGGIYREKKVAEMGFRGESVCKVTPLFRYAAPVSEAKAQGVTDEQAAFEAAVAAVNERGWSTSTDLARQIWDAARLNAAPAAPAADTGLVEALCHISLCSNNSMSSKADCGKIARAALAAHRAKGVV